MIDDFLLDSVFERLTGWRPAWAEGPPPVPSDAEVGSALRRAVRRLREEPGEDLLALMTRELG